MNCLPNIFRFNNTVVQCLAQILGMLIISSKNYNWAVHLIPSAQSPNTLSRKKNGKDQTLIHLYVAIMGFIVGYLLL